jgi:hypothetical protein
MEMNDDVTVQRYLETYGGYETQELIRIWKENDRRITGAEELFGIPLVHE